MALNYADEPWNILASKYPSKIRRKFTVKGLFGLLGIGNLKVVLISTILASKDWWGVNTYQSYKENFTNCSNYSYRWSLRGKDTIGTRLASNYWGTCKNYRENKKIKNGLDTQIYRLLSGHFFEMRHLLS